MNISLIIQNIDLLSFLTFLATLAAVLATYLTVREIKKQRESSYHPELYIGNQSIYLYAHKWKEKYLPFNYSNEILDNINKRQMFNAIKVDLHNVGFGVAKAVEYQWSMDVNKAIEKIETINKLDFFSIEYKGDIKVTVPSWEFTFMDMVSNQLREEKINFILPSSIERIPSQIILPNCYVNLYIIFLILNLNFYSSQSKSIDNEGVDDLNIDDFPKLNLNLNYKDFHGNTKNKKFELSFKFSVISSPESV